MAARDPTEPQGAMMRKLGCNKGAARNALEASELIERYKKL